MEDKIVHIFHCILRKLSYNIIRVRMRSGEHSKLKIKVQPYGD